ncbi:MAG: two-component regulator propeller domain-containing protein [Balneolaceae bacterium]
MIRGIKILSTLLVVFALGEMSYSQTLPFRSYSIEQGLSESVVHSLIQDEKGYIWAGTGFGLNRFDGMRFKKYYEDDGLPDSRVNAIIEDDNNTLWLGTNLGVAIMQEDSIRIPDYLSELNEYIIHSIFQDSDQNIWISTEENGVWRLNQNRELLNITEQFGYEGIQGRTVAQTPDGTIWIGTGSGIARLEGREFTFYEVMLGSSMADIRDVQVSNDGTLWIGSSEGLFHLVEGQLNKYGRNVGLNDVSIQSISITDEGTVWVGTESGASHFDGNKFTNYTSEQGLLALIVYETLVDREGNVWLGTLGGGLNYFSGEIFNNYNVDSGLTNNMVNAFAEDHQGNIWVGMYGGGVSRFDGNSFTYLDESDGLVDNKIYTLFEDSRQRLWIGTRDGLSVYENGRVQKISEEIFPFRVIRKIVEDDEGYLWIATYNDGVIRFDGENYRQYNTESGLLNNTVMDIKIDKEGTLWFATYGGVASYDGVSFDHYTIGDGLPSNGVIHVHIDHNDDLWFSTFNGIAKMEGETIRSLISDDQVGIITYFTIQDHDNRYWVGTNRGIYEFDPEQYFEAENRVGRIRSFKLFNVNQGLVANELNAGASLVTTDGTIWLGTVEGLSHFYPERIRENSTPPGIEFEEIMVSGISASEEGNQIYSHDQNFVQISFTGLSYYSPNQILYEFRLKGLDQGWQSTRERMVRFPSLSPNQYEFEVRAFNADGISSKKTASFQFVIKQPVWLQWWFIALLIIAVIGLILFYYRYFRATKQIDIERMRVQIASDLHDDVGSSLTELALQTDFLRAGEISDELRDTLQQLGDQSRKIVTSLDDIVWSIDARNDTAGDMTDRMQDYINQIFQGDEPVVFYDFGNLKMDEKIPVHIKENIYLIFKESVNNIAKHSNATKVNVIFTFNGKIFELLVRDNGTSFKTDRKSGQGLRNIKLRAERVNAEVTIENKEGFMVQVNGKI